MSFVKNDFQQMTIWDDMFQLTDREKRMLEKSWAIPFSEYIFPAIDESPYKALYSEKDSRPNTPVNIIIGALILKEVNGLTDDEVLDAVMFDVRYRVALHTTSYEEQPISDRTLGRFRERCLKYLEETGTDLFHDTIRQLADITATLTEADRSLLRMDSLMVESNIRRLSRKELIYETAKKAVKEYAKDNPVPDELEHYLDPADHNKLFYNAAITDEDVLNEADKVKELCGSENDILNKVLEQQTEKDDNGNRVFKAPEELSASNIQSPYDTDAGYRTKGKVSHIGYVANVIEVTGPNGSVILDYSYERNTYSDSRFLKDAVDVLGVQENEVTLVTDGGYSGENNTVYAKEHNIKLVTTNLAGRRSQAYTDYRKTEEFKKCSAFRNGVETIPSYLRRCCSIDIMPVRGKNRTAFYFGCKIGALNFRKLCISLQRKLSCPNS